MVAELPTAQSQLYTPVAFFAAVYKQAKETRDCLGLGGVIFVYLKCLLFKEVHVQIFY